MDLLTTREAARIMRCSPNHLRHLGIRRVRLGRRVLYRLDQLEAHVAASTEGTVQ